MEIVDKFNNKRQALNITRERYEHIEGEYGLACHFWIVNDKGELLIQKRNPNKKVYPGLWSTSGGGVDAGETTLETSIRECKEELGIEINENEIELALSYRRKKDFLDVYIVRKNIDLKDIVMQEEEVVDVKWITPEALQGMFDSSEFAPNLKIYFDLLLNIINKEN